MAPNKEVWIRHDDQRIGLYGREGRVEFVVTTGR
jgi:hypothetical protein